VREVLDILENIIVEAGDLIESRSPELAAAARAALRRYNDDFPRQAEWGRCAEGGSDSRIKEALRAWRLAEAKQRGVPAFRILSDQALRAMATRRPETARELLAIPGIAITTVEKYAGQFYRILQKRGG
jgi:superfamily II DNA helicase RecQ